jgi:hypothetical protein
LLSGSCFAADDAEGGISENFRFTAILTTEDEQNYTAVRLTPEVVGKLKSDLSDMLLVSNGRAVPYFINSCPFTETLTPAMSVRQDGKTTVIGLDGLRNLTLSEIEIKTDDMFKRNVYVNGHAYTLYNLVFGSGSYRDLTVPMNGYMCLSDQLDILIDNGDDAPIEIDSVSVSYTVYDAVFQNTRSPVTLYLGDDAISGPPRYDIINYKEHIIAEGYGISGIGEISEQSVESEKVPITPDYTMLFNIIIVVAAVLLAVLLIIQLKKVK